MQLFVSNIFIAPAKKQLRASSLCHSLVPHTYGQLSLRYKLTAAIFANCKVYLRNSMFVVDCKGKN